MSPRAARARLVSLIFSLLLLGRALAVRAQAEVRVELQMARWAARGSSVRLRCAHDVPPHLLYKVEFLREGIKIFQYVKDRKPPYRNFTIPGAILDVSTANEDSITLQNVDFSASGTYSCEVSLETPIYTKASSDRELSVFYPQKYPPRITFGAPLYTVGDLLEANCTSSPAYPAPHLTWLLNGKRVDDMMLSTYTYHVPLTYRGGRRRPHRQRLAVPVERPAARRDLTVAAPGCTLRDAQICTTQSNEVAPAAPPPSEEIHTATTRPHPRAAPLLAVTVSALRVAAAGRLELVCLSTIPAHRGATGQYADEKNHTVTVDVIVSDAPERPARTSKALRLTKCFSLLASVALLQAFQVL